MTSVHAEVVKTSANQDKATADIEVTSVKSPADKSAKLTPKELELKRLRLLKRMKYLGSPPTLIGGVLSVASLLFGGALMVVGRGMMQFSNESATVDGGSVVIALGGLFFAGGLGTTLKASQYREAEDKLLAEAQEYGLDLSTPAREMRRDYDVKYAQQLKFWGIVSMIVGGVSLFVGAQAYQVNPADDEAMARMTVGGSLGVLGGLLLWRSSYLSDKDRRTSWLAPGLIDERPTVNFGFTF